MLANRSGQGGETFSSRSPGPAEEAVGETPDEFPPLPLLLAGLSLERDLTARERQVVVAAIRGLDTKMTATELDISPKTVDEMWRRVYLKFRCRSRVQVLSRLLEACFGLLAIKPRDPFTGK